MCGRSKTRGKDDFFLLGLHPRFVHHLEPQVSSYDVQALRLCGGGFDLMVWADSAVSWH